MKRIITIALILISALASAQQKHIVHRKHRVSHSVQQKYEDDIYTNTPARKRSLFGNPNGNYFAYSYPLDIAYGFSHINMRDGFTNEFGGVKAPTSFTVCELTAFGVYHASMEASEYTGYGVMGYSIITNCDYHRVGLELGKFFWWTKSGLHTLSVTPFYAWGRSGVCDTSYNTIGWSDSMMRARDNFRQRIEHYGVKIAYSYNFLEAGIIVSKNEISISLALIAQAPASVLKGLF